MENFGSEILKIRKIKTHGKFAFISFSDDGLGFVGLINMNLFWHTLLSGTWMLLVVNVARNLYTVYQTQVTKISYIHLL